MNDEKYIKDLEEIAKIITKPFKNLPFNSVIRLLSGCKVLSFDENNKTHKELLEKISTACKKAGMVAHKEGIFTTRPNEAGNEIEKFVKKELDNLGIEADVPVTKEGKKKASGYPDIEISYEGGNVYLECKTYNLKSYDTTYRSFYFSPSEDFKVAKDALHFMVSYQLEKDKRKNQPAFIPVYWKLYSLEALKVDLKQEFNQSNKKMYGELLKNYILAEGGIQYNK